MSASPALPAMRAFNSRQARRQEAIRALTDSRTKDAPTDLLASRTPSPSLSSLSNARSGDGADDSVQRHDSSSSNATTRDYSTAAFRRPKKSAGDMTKAGALLGLADASRRPSVVSIPHSTSTSSDRRDSFWSAGQRLSAASSTTTVPEQYQSSVSAASQPQSLQHYDLPMRNPIKLDTGAYRSPVPPIAELEPTLPSSLSMPILSHPPPSPARATYVQQTPADHSETKNAAQFAYEKEAAVPHGYLIQAELSATEPRRSRSQSSAAAIQSTPAMVARAMRRQDGLVNSSERPKSVQGYQQPDPTSPVRQYSPAAFQPLQYSTYTPSFKQSTGYLAPEQINSRTSSRTSKTIMVQSATSTEHYARPQSPGRDSMALEHTSRPANTRQAAVSTAPAEQTYGHGRHPSNTSTRTASSLQYAETPTIEEAAFLPFQRSELVSPIMPPPRSPARPQSQLQHTEPRSPQARRNLNFSKPFGSNSPVPSGSPQSTTRMTSLPTKSVHFNTELNDTFHPAPPAARRILQGLGLSQTPLDEEDEANESDASSTTTASTTSTTSSSPSEHETYTPPSTDHLRPPSDSGDAIMPGPTIPFAPRQTSHLRTQDPAPSRSRSHNTSSSHLDDRPVTYQPSGLSRGASVPDRSSAGGASRPGSSSATASDPLTFESTLAGPFDFSKTVL